VTADISDGNGRCVARMFLGFSEAELRFTARGRKRQMEFV